MDYVQHKRKINNIQRTQDVLQFKGGYFKDERSLGGRGGRPNAVSISNNDVIV